ncbi:MAG: FAD-binding oxidoreductase, partial [Bacteroidetes bacterium]
NRILLGGARNTSFATENTTDTQVHPTIESALHTFLQEHFLVKGEVSISHQWSGTMGFTAGKMPVLHQPVKGLFQACGCNGMGVALTPILAKQWVNIL